MDHEPGYRDRVNARRRAYFAGWYRKNQKRLLQKAADFREANRELVAARNRAYYLANADKIRIYGAAWYQANKEMCLVASRAWRSENRDRYQATQQRYYAANRESLCAKVAEWRRANPDKVSAILAGQRSRKRAARVWADRKVIAEFYCMVRGADQICCYWCANPIPKGLRQIDHIKPLAKGGLHAILNLCCSCRSCNQRKSAKLPEDFSRQLLIPFHEMTPVAA